MQSQSWNPDNLGKVPHFEYGMGPPQAMAVFMLFSGRMVRNGSWARGHKFGQLWGGGALDHAEVMNDY